MSARPRDFDAGLVSRFKLMTVEEIVQLEPPKWLIAGILPESAPCVLYGEPGAGKTFLALDWALCIATGTPWLGHGAEPGEVVYVYAEGIRGIKQRYCAWLKERGLTAAANFRALPCPVDMLNGRAVGSLAIAILNAGVKPRLIVVDTVARCFGAGDEN